MCGIPEQRQPRVPARCRRSSRREKAVSRQEGVRWLRRGGTQGCWTQSTGCICIPAGAESPLLRPPAVPRHRKTENMFLLVADGFYFHSLCRSDTYTAMLSPYEGQGPQRKAPCPAGPPSLLRLGRHLTGGRGSRGGKKKKIKFSSDLIYLNKYKYNFYIKLFTDKQASQTQKGDLYVFSYFC